MTKTIKTEAVLKQDGKAELLYLKNVPTYFASVLDLKKKYKSEEREYALTVFVDEETKDKLELPVDEGGIGINKELREVGVGRNNKKKIKYPLEKQLKDGGFAYDDVKGLYGMSLSLNEFTKKGKKSILKVVDSEGKEWPKDKLIGNGSKVHIKLWAYRNQDDQLVVFPNLIVVAEHVPYEGGNGVVEDDVLGVSVDMSSSYSQEEKPSEPDFDDDIPFDTDSSDDDEY